MNRPIYFWWVVMWGTLGILGLLGFSVYRLSIIAYEIVSYPMQWWHWGSALIWVVFMAYSEGYKGFQRMFAPRVAARLYWLTQQKNWWLAVAAPAFGMGFLYANRKRLLVSYCILLMVIVFVSLAAILPSPWRAIMDCGVVVGLVWGMVATFLSVLTVFANQTSRVDPDLPLSAMTMAKQQA